MSHCQGCADLERELAAARRTISEAHAVLGWAHATLEIIHDRHADLQDVSDGPDGPVANADMHTVTDCSQALAMIAKVRTENSSCTSQEKP